MCKHVADYHLFSVLTNAATDTSILTIYYIFLLVERAEI